MQRGEEEKTANLDEFYFSHLLFVGVWKLALNSFDLWSIIQLNKQNVRIVRQFHFKMCAEIRVSNERLNTSKFVCYCIKKKRRKNFCVFYFHSVSISICVYINVYWICWLLLALLSSMPERLSNWRCKRKNVTRLRWNSCFGNESVRNWHISTRSFPAKDNFSSVKIFLI